jgi:predicted DNA-binding transcriptional regulator AlpA
MKTDVLLTIATSMVPRDYTRLPTETGMIPDPYERPVLTAEEAFAELGIDRSTGYKAIREGTFPVPVIRIGRVIRVPTESLRRVLQLDDPKPARRSDARDQEDKG